MLSTYDDKSKSVVWPKGRGGGFKTFQESIELLGHQDRTVDILKLTVKVVNGQHTRTGLVLVSLFLKPVSKIDKPTSDIISPVWHYLSRS
jgi:hypothetical protein